jgi:hypothetical protein
MLNHLGLHQGLSSSDIMPDNLFHHPGFMARNRPAFYDPHSVANLATQLIVSHNALADMDDFLIQPVTVRTTDLYDDRFLHLIAGYKASNATAIIHATPSFPDILSRSVRAVNKRAIIRRV